MKTVLIDDETKTRETIRNVIELHAAAIEIIGEADGCQSGYELILKKKPELVFLDVQMRDGTGFDLLKKFDTLPFKVIFITAFEHYAIRAFKFSALDYLLKPVHPDDLIAAVEKAKAATEKDSITVKFETFISNLENIGKEVKKIILKTSDSIHVLNVNEIIRCEADGNYTVFFLTNGKKILVSNTLKEYDELLSAYKFFRAHQSHLVNIQHILSYEKKEGGYLIMKDQSTVPVAIRKKETLLGLLEKI